MTDILITAGYCIAGYLLIGLVWFLISWLRDTREYGGWAALLHIFILPHFLIKWPMILAALLYAAYLRRK